MWFMVLEVVRIFNQNELSRKFFIQVINNSNLILAEISNILKTTNFEKNKYKINI
jgi:hypothetical protein